MPRIRPVLHDRRTAADIALGAHLAGIRRDRGLTQAAVAARLSVPQSWVGKTETGRRRLSFVEAVALAAALEVGVEDLVPPDAAGDSPA